MSENPPPPGSGRNHEGSGDDQQGHWPNPAERHPSTGRNQPPDSGWERPTETGWAQRPSNGWNAPPAGSAASGRQYPRPKHPQSESPQAQAAQGQAVQGQYARPQQVQPPYPQPQNQYGQQGQYAQGQYGQQGQYAQGPYLASPAAKPRGRKGLLAIGAVLIVVVGLGIGWGAATLFGSNSSDGDTVAAPASSEATIPGDEPSSSQDPSESPGASESPALPDDPVKALDQLVETDRPNVKADLNGKWVPQLSSKKLGLEADGKAWEEKDILAEHQELRAEFPRVQLVWSGDFASFKEDDFWVTVVGIGYDDPDQALSWCSSHGLGADYCYAKQLNTTGGTDGTTRLQD